MISWKMTPKQLAIWRQERKWEKISEGVIKAFVGTWAASIWIGSFGMILCLMLFAVLAALHAIAAWFS